MGKTMNRTMVGAALVVVAATMVAGCSDKVTGNSATTADTARATSATAPPATVSIAAAGMAGVVCAKNQFAWDVWCDTPSVRATSPAAGKVRISEGTAIRFGGVKGDDRICTVGAIVRDNAGATWALSAWQCAIKVGTVVYTADGIEIGKVDQVVKNVREVALDSSTHWELPAVKLSDAAVATPTAKGTAVMGDGTRATVRGAASTVAIEGTNSHTLGITGSPKTPDASNGDAGAPVFTAAEKLTGVLIIRGDAAPVGDIADSLIVLGNGAKIATT